MTGLPDNNGNDFIRGLETRACVNGMTKSDVERLKNALVKKILDDETVIDVTEDGSIIADSNGMSISVNGKLLGLSVDGEDVIPVTEPYLPEDENENPLAPPNDTIMTSANIAVDPRIVHTTGNEKTTGIKQGNWQGYTLTKASGVNGKWTRYCSINATGIGGRIIECYALTADNAVAYCEFIIAGGGGQRNESILNIPNLSNTTKIVIARNNDIGANEIWIYSTDAWKISSLNFTSKFGDIPVDNISYYNVTYDTLFGNGANYSSPLYVLGSA